jgi:drug/metabolite transporter (DMT)-like permease
MTGLASLLWGTTFAAAQFGLGTINPFQLAFFRFLVAGPAALLVGCITFRPRTFFPLFRTRVTWILGVVYACNFVPQYLGQSLSGPAAASVLTNLAPTFTPVVAFFVLRERIHRPQVIATVVGLSGLLVITLPTFSGRASPVGDALLVWTSLLFTGFIVMSKQLGAGSLESTLAILVTAAIVLTPISLILGRMSWDSFALSPSTWATVLWLGIPCTVVAIFLYLRGLSGITASQSARLLDLQLTTGLFWSELLFAQPLRITLLVGMGLIALAIYISAIVPVNPPARSESPGLRKS